VEGFISEEKLLFLYCKENSNDHYSFFPYKYGCFSFESYTDRRILINKGLILDENSFHLNTDNSYYLLLSKKDKISLAAFYNKYKNYSRQQLIKYTYLKYPH